MYRVRRFIRRIWRYISKNIARYLAPIAGFLLLAAGVYWGNLGFASAKAGAKDEPVTFRSEFYSNASTELVSIGVTVLVIDWLNRLRAREDEKRRLVLQMGSPDNTVATEAVRILRLEGWGFRDNTTLQNADLYEADLQETKLYDANLEGADLRRANLEGAGLVRANLAWANLRGTNLQKAELGEANLVMADLETAIYNEETVLPDGSFWTPDTELARFTDPLHPDFWRSDYPYSPAYRGDEADTDRDD